MYVFTPNTVIRSTEVNQNFEEVADIANWSNPYKFSAYMSATQVLSTDAWTKLNVNTEVYDTNSNYDTTTYGYTAPITGYYTFSLTVLLLSQAGGPFLIALGKNSTAEYARLCEIPNCTGNTTLTGTVELYLASGDIMYPLARSTTASKTVNNTFMYNRFSGRLTSAT